MGHRVLDDRNRERAAQGINHMVAPCHAV
jgi:hypothetical protein